MFVDYGTPDCLPYECMRKDLYTTEIPVQSVKLKLDNILPEGEKWQEEELKILHNLVVENNFTVDIRGVQVSRIYTDIVISSFFSHLALSGKLLCWKSLPYREHALLYSGHGGCLHVKTRSPVNPLHFVASFCIYQILYVCLSI